MNIRAYQIDGKLVTLVARDLRRPLDAFWARGARQKKSLLIIVHGMGGNFYRSRLKKELMRQAPAHGLNVLSFNNRGSEQEVTRERFTDSAKDLEAALAFAESKGYRQVILLGHSTGCQKIIYFQARRKHPLVRGLILAGLGDDYAIARRELKRRLDQWVHRARQLIRSGKGHQLLPKCCLGFSARRFLSVADPRQTEASLFNMDGPLTLFRRVEVPLLAIIGSAEEYACIPVQTMLDKLATRTRSRAFTSRIVEGGDHSFLELEEKASRTMLEWAHKTTTR